MCSRDDDPTMHDRGVPDYTDPRVADVYARLRRMSGSGETDACPDCGHSWSAHMSALALAMGINPVPCIEDGSSRGRYICACPRVGPPSAMRPVPGHV